MGRIVDEQPPAMTVAELLEALGPEGDFAMVAGGARGIERTIGRRTIQRMGVAMTGYVEHQDHDRVQMMGRSEWGFLNTLPRDERLILLRRVLRTDFPALVVTAGHIPGPGLSGLADELGFALIATQLESIDATERLNTALARHLLPHEGRHAVLMDVYGVGVLMTGPSGIGKSEVGLELVTRGHRLVADDYVLVEQTEEHTVVGSCPEITRHHMEIRGLGIINIKDLFGAAAVRDRKRVELMVELVEWSADDDYERLGLDMRFARLAGIEVQHVVLPARPGRSMSILIEVAARNHLLQLRGTHSARAFADRLHQHLAAAGTSRSTETGERGVE